jgi:hypothetical protein
LEWPALAEEWEKRPRPHSWPDLQTIQRVVSNACDVVFVAHRLCKQDERMKKTMHRLSFSRAETVLLNSWTPTQQIVYHILRYFVKTAGLIELSVDESMHSTNGILCNYHLKTLMLWACERHSEQWWSTSLVNTTAGCCEYWANG